MTAQVADSVVVALLIAGSIAANGLLAGLVLRDYRAVLKKERVDIRNNHHEEIR